MGRLSTLVVNLVRDAHAHPDYELDTIDCDLEQLTCRSRRYTPSRLFHDGRSQRGCHPASRSKSTGRQVGSSQTISPRRHQILPMPH